MLVIVPEAVTWRSTGDFQPCDTVERLPAAITFSKSSEDQSSSQRGKFSSLAASTGTRRIESRPRRPRQRFAIE